MNKKLIISLLLLISVLLSACNLAKNNTNDIKEKCEGNSGNWIEEYNECEYISQKICSELGGVFNECGSACRHSEDPNGICTMQCVPFCIITQ